MNVSSLGALLINALLHVLEFLASPSGGRDIGREILRNLGLRGGSGRRG